MSHSLSSWWGELGADVQTSPDGGEGRLGAGLHRSMGLSGSHVERRGVPRFHEGKWYQCHPGEIFPVRERPELTDKILPYSALQFTVRLMPDR